MSAFIDYPKGRFYKGDCLEVMKEIPDGCIDMILCDLPYGTTACKWDTIIPFDKLWEQYNRIVKDNGAIVLFGAEPFSSLLRCSNAKNYKYDWYWKKSVPQGFLNAKKMPLRNIETISVFYENLPTYNPQGLLQINKSIKNSKSKRGLVDSGEAGHNGGRLAEGYVQTDTNYPNQILEFKSESKTFHPTQKPVELFEYLIKTYTNENDLILDNCAGSATTAIAAINTNRKFVLIEQDDNYFNLANERIQKHLSELK